MESIEKPAIDIYNIDDMSGISQAEANEIIKNNPLLRGDVYTNKVVDNDYVVEVNNEQKELIPGVFVCLRLAFLETMRADSVLNKGQNHKLEREAAMIVNSGDRVVTADGVADV